MLKFKATAPNGRILLGFVLEPENVRRMTEEADPILVHLEAAGFEGIDIMIAIDEKDSALDNLQKHFGPISEYRDEEGHQILWTTMNTVTLYLKLK